MSSRAIKRQKLSPRDEANGEAAERPAAQSHVTRLDHDATTRAELTSSPTKTANTNDSAIAKELWKAAKAKSLEGRTGRKEVTSSPSRGTQSPLKSTSRPIQNAASPSKVTKSPGKLPFDPLRNQRSSLGGSPSKPGTSLDFFKQFARKPDAQSNGALSASTTATTPGKPRLLDALKAAAEEGQASNKITVASSEKKSSKSKPSWHYESNGAKSKTFEDQIRDLEATARKEAEAEGTEDETPDEGSARRSSKRQGQPRKPFEAIETIRVRKSVTPSIEPEKPLDRRKRKPAVEPKPKLVVASQPAPEPKTDVFFSPLKPQSLPTIDDAAIVVSTPRKQPVVVSTSTETTVDVTVPTSLEQLPERDLSPAQLSCIQHVILQKLTGKRASPLIGLNDAHSKVARLVEQTITAGESNSMLLIGSRGSGKTALINHIIAKHTKERPDDFHVIRLSGFIHTDDKLALREIWRQLGREMDVDDDEGASKNYADTLATLLALLSHPAEFGRDESGTVTKSVIFIIDEFELFANHPRQTLLYNLFDIAQSRKAPIAVLGLTTRIDVSESLEKRVKSRFSHRYVHLSMAKSFTSFVEMCRSALLIDPLELSAEEAKTLSDEPKSKPTKPSTLDTWRILIDHFLHTPSTTTHLRHLYSTTKSVPDFHTTLLLPISTLPTTSSFPQSPTTLQAHLTTTLQPTLLPPTSNLTLLQSLSTLQLALLISAARQSAIHATDLVTFALAYDEYKSLASKAKLQASAAGALAAGAAGRVWGREVARGAWEGLIEAGLVIRDGRGGSAGAGRVDVALEEIGGAGVELGAWGRWCREI